MSQDFTDDCFGAENEAQSDLANMEKNFAALKSMFSGASAPANTVAIMPWGDTTAHILKIRNEANDAWINLINLATGRVPDSDACSGITITAGTGLSGGGALSANRTISHAAHTGDVTGSTALSIAAARVAQSHLKTSQGSVSLDGGESGASANLTLPGGEYGYYPQVRVNGGYRNLSANIASTFNGTSYTTNIHLSCAVGIVYAQQRYVTSSGEVHWIFLLRDKATKKILATFQSPDHPCMGNGGKPLVTLHPFPDFDAGTQEIVVINPTLEEVLRINDRCIVPGETEPDRDFIDVIHSEYIIEEKSNPLWPEQAVTVGLPAGTDWRRMPDGTKVDPIKKFIPKAGMLIAKAMRRK